MDNAKVRIAIVTSSLGIGGAERANAQLSILLDNLGFEVYIISILDHIEYEYRGTLLNLGTYKNADDTPFGRLKRMLLMRKYIRQNDFRYVIDSRTRTIPWSEFIISRWVYNPRRVIYTVHSHNIGFYFPNNKFIAKKIYKKSPFIVAVSDEIKKAIEKEYGYRNVIRIYNPVVEFDIKPRTESHNKYILAYGRIDDEVKNFSLLIEAYSKSELPSKNVSLYIMGDGKDVEMLSDKVKSLDLSEKIIFMPRREDPFSIVQSAYFTMLTSRFEGFPLAIVESLSIGVPVVSVDCSSGPRELIQHEENGLLVENHNPIALAGAMNRLIDDSALYAHCKKNAAASVAHLSVENIAAQWKQILI